RPQQRSSRCRVLLVRGRCVVGGLLWGPRVWGVGGFGLVLGGCGLLGLGWGWAIAVEGWRCWLGGVGGVGRVFGSWGGLSGGCGGVVRVGWCWSVTVGWWRCLLVGLWGLMFSL